MASDVAFPDRFTEIDELTRPDQLLADWSPTRPARGTSTGSCPTAAVRLAVVTDERLQRR